MSNLVVIRPGETMRLYPFENKPELLQNVERASLYLVKMSKIDLPPLMFTDKVEPYSMAFLGRCEGGLGWLYPDGRTRDGIGEYILEIHEKEEKVIGKWCWLLIGLSEHMPELKKSETDENK